MDEPIENYCGAFHEENQQWRARPQIYMSIQVEMMSLHIAGLRSDLAKTAAWTTARVS